MTAACVIGWPVAHSRSPLIHSYWLQHYGLNGSYQRRAVPPDGLSKFLAGMRAEGFVGCNVTLPHKEGAQRAAAQVTEAARAVGAANTLWFEDAQLVADNTDGTGFLAHVRATVPDFPRSDRSVSVLGAGGAARAIIHAVLSAGAPEVCIFNRTRERAERVAHHFGRRVIAHGWDRRLACSRSAGALINATVLGMEGSPALDFDVGGLAADCLVADIVYVPLITPLLAAARAQGLATIDGLGMLLHQAVPGFERWFGVRPQVTDELRALLVADLRAR